MGLGIIAFFILLTLDMAGVIDWPWRALLMPLIFEALTTGPAIWIRARYVREAEMERAKRAQLLAELQAERLHP